ncbi:RNA-directed DNA polymerase, eukaryota [Tanacetum coccineum]
MIRLKKKLQLLKKKIRGWVMDYKRQQVGRVNDLKAKLSVIDKELDQGRVSSDDLLLSRMESMKLLHDFQSSINRDNIQKAKICWAIEGDENSKFFHAIINKKRANLSVKGVMVDGEWMDDPSRVKEEFHNHFATRFQDPGANRGNINFTFPNRLSLDQVSDLESPISRDEIRLAVWGCGEDKSPGPDGFTFEFFRKFWKVVGPDFCIAVEWFFEHGSFAIGCNSSFVALIPKILDPKIVSDYRPISLIGSLYKVITKILATRLSSVISSLISDVQSAFLPNRQILDGPFILSELLSWCKFKYNQAMVFKVDFAKAYDSISLISGKASILVNGSPTSEFQFHRGLSINVKKSQLLGIGISYSIVFEAAKSLDWQGWFKQLRLGAKSKEVLEGVFYVSWWSLWDFRNHLLFADSNPRKDAIFDEIVLRSFNWCLARGNRTLNWVSWLQHPHLISM